MDIKEIRILKLETEKKMLEILSDFEKKSGLYISGFDVKRVEYVSARSELTNCNIEVSLDIE